MLTLLLLTMMSFSFPYLQPVSEVMAESSIPSFVVENKFVYEGGAAFQWLDAHVSYYQFDYWLLQQTLETLLWYNGSSSTQVIPWLAESYTQINATTYEFTLRQNIKFQDGTPFNATAVWFSLNRLLIMDGTSGTGIHGSQSAWIVEQMLDTSLSWAFTGYQPYDSAWVKKVLDQNFVQILDTYTIRLNIKTPVQLQFPYLLLSGPWASIISPTSVIAKDYSYHNWGTWDGNYTKYFEHMAGVGDTYFNVPQQGWRIGTGPYYIQSVEPTTYRVVLMANPAYWGGPNNIERPIGQPKISEIDFNYVQSFATRLNDLEAGNATGIAVPQSNIFSVVDRDEWLLNGTFKSLIPEVTIYGPFTQFSNTWFNFITNVTDAEGQLRTFQPMADRRIRLAIASAVNLTDININVNNRLGQVANNLIPPDTAPEGAYNPSITPPWSYNLTKAAELLVDAMKNPMTSFTYYNGTPIPEGIIDNSFGDTDDDGVVEISYTIEMYVGSRDTVHQTLLTTLATNLNRTAANVEDGGNATGLYFAVVPVPGGQQYTLASQHRIYMYWGGWVADYNHVLNWLTPMYRSTNTYGMWNQMNYTTLDGYVQAARQADAAGNLTALLHYNDLANQFADDNVLFFYTFYPLTYFVRSSFLEGWYYNPALQGEYFATFYYPVEYTYTPAGENVTAPLTQDVNITFDQVSSGGITSLYRTETGPAPPGGFELAGQYYEIQTNATFSGEITIRIAYDDSGMTQLVEATLRLNQWDETLQQWVDITTQVDTVNNIIYGVTTHLSIFGVRNIIPVPQEIEILNLASSKTVVCQGYNVTISVTLLNQGGSTKTFDVFVYANSSLIGSRTVSNLAPSQQTTIAINGTANVAKGNYTLSVFDRPISWVIVAMIGDITGPNGWPDGKVEMRDVALVCRYFGQRVPPAPPNCDVDNNGKVEIKDIAIVAKNFGKTDP